MLHIEPTTLTSTHALRGRADVDDVAHVFGCSACPVRGTSICGAEDDSDLSALDPISRHLAFPKKSLLMSEDSSADYVYNVVSGAVLLSRLLFNGKRQVIGIALPGDVIGLGHAERYTVTGTALGHVDACRYPRTAFDALLEQSPALFRRLHASVERELGLAQDHMMLLGQCTAEQRLVGFLISLRSRRARVNGPARRIDLPMTREDIADFLGLTLETVSRSMSALARKGVIAIIPDGIRVLDNERLESVLAAAA